MQWLLVTLLYLSPILFGIRVKQFYVLAKAQDYPTNIRLAGLAHICGVAAYMTVSIAVVVLLLLHYVV